MHEAMIAQSIFDIITAETKKQNAKPIKAKISCGTFNAVNDDVLSMAFESISRETVLQNIKLEIEHKPMRAKCHKCSQVFDFEIVRPLCSRCGSEQYDLLPDEPLLIEEIEFEVDQSDE